MKIAKIALGVSALALMAAPAMAQDAGAYGTIGVKTIEFDTYSLEGRIGYNFTEILSLEGQASVGVIDDEEFGVEVQEDYSLGAFLRARAPISEQFNLFGRIGYQLSEFSVDTGTIEGSEDFDGVAFGGGVEYMFNPLNGVRLEYTAVDYGGEGGIDVGTADTVSLSFVRNF